MNNNICIEVDNIDIYMDLIEESVKSFEYEALNIDNICISNVDSFMKEYKNSFFKTKKSISIIKKEVKRDKRIKKDLQLDIACMMKIHQSKRKSEEMMKKKRKTV